MEFDNLEAFVQNHINSRETTSVATSDENMRRNRYRDMVPFDSNIVYLDWESGNPLSKYINASWVKTKQFVKIVIFSLFRTCQIHNFHR